MLRLTQTGTREKSVVNEIFGGYLRSQGINLHLLLQHVCFVEYMNKALSAAYLL